MKKIISGKRYDTETAQKVAHYSNGLGRRDFRGYDEDLYRTKNGNWFLYGDGGPMTKYARPCGNMTSGGTDIIPLTAADAQLWLEEKGFNEEVERYFAESVVDA